MTKKDYIKFVDVWKKSIKFINSEDQFSFQYIDTGILYKELCTMFSNDNPNFDEKRFGNAVALATWEQKKESRKLPL